MYCAVIACELNNHRHEEEGDRTVADAGTLQILTGVCAFIFGEKKCMLCLKVQFAHGVDH